MLAHQYLAQGFSFAALLYSQSLAASCPTRIIADLLKQADEARSISEFWEEDGPSEALAELDLAIQLFGRAEFMLVRTDCLNAPGANGFSLQVANGQRWARRFAAKASGLPTVVAKISTGPSDVQSEASLK